TPWDYRQGAGAFGRASGLGLAGALGMIGGSAGILGGGGLAVASSATVVGAFAGAGIATAGAAIGLVGARSMGQAVDALRNALATGKEGATDVPSWAKGNRPNPGESGKDFARRLMDEKYGPGGYPTGPGSEFSKI